MGATHTGCGHTDGVTEPRQEFVVGDASRLPGGVRLVGYAARGQSAGIHLGVPSATLTVINAAMLPKYKVCRMRPV